MYTIDWVSYILPRCDYKAKCEQTHNGERIVKPKYRGINVNMAHLYKGF